MHEKGLSDIQQRKSTLSEKWNAELRAEQELRAQWNLGKYTGASCPNCGRVRLCHCPNGKTRCEKCNWVPEDGGYCEVSA